MVRKQICLEREQERLLKQRAKAMGLSEAEVIRRALEAALHSGAPTFIPDPAAWERLKADIEARIAGGPLPGKRTWKREDAYAERLDRSRQADSEP